MNNSIRTENLNKNFGRTRAVVDINLDIKEGEIFGLLGPNGAGKTTTIKLLTGLLRPTSGRVYIKDIDIEKDPCEAKRKFALLPDVPYIYKKLTGWEFMNFIAKIYEVKRDNIDEEIEQQLEIFNLKDVAHDLTESYSHGLKQRLLLASAMFRDPDIMILDEPMVGLDPEAARMVKNIFKDIAGKNKTIFLSTHTLTDAQELCSRIAIIDKGSIIASGSIGDLKESISGDSDNLEDIYFSITRNA
ncbi:ABC transporter ATP-binding protein [Elusimicrobiota bacterium]